jgi:hypothetical protein
MATKVKSARQVEPGTYGACTHDCPQPEEAQPDLAFTWNDPGSAVEQNEAFPTHPGTLPERLLRQSTPWQVRRRVRYDDDHRRRR